jgi:hypothetical protein
MRLAVVPLLAACNQLLEIPDIHRGDCDADAPFVQLAPVAGLDAELGEQGGQLSRDERTIVFSRLTVAGNPASPVPHLGDLYLAERDTPDAPFGAATALVELNTELDELGASLSEDRLTLYFDRSDLSQRYHIYAARRSSPVDVFGAPVALALGDGTRSDRQPFITPAAIFFASTRSDGTASLLAASGRGTSFEPARPLASLETLPGPTAYENPVVSTDGLTIYFSAPPDNATPRDIWTASRAVLDQPFGSPHPVAALNTLNAERPTWISDDSCRLYFVTNRAGRGFSLWMASRRR